MRHHLRLELLLPTLAGLALAACGEGTSGQVTQPPDAGGSSSSSSSTSGSVPPPSELDVCNGSKYTATDGVTAGTSMDYFSVRNGVDVQASPKEYIVSESGTPCASPNAAEATQCLRELDALRADRTGWNVVSFDAPDGPRYVAVTSGTKVTALRSVAAVAAFLSPLDARDAAFLATATEQYRFACDGTLNVRSVAGGHEVTVLSGIDCGANNKIERHTLLVATDGTITVKETSLVKAGEPGCNIGRRPEGLAQVACDDTANAVGAFFAATAHLEAASVVSFERLAAELTALGAPPELVDAAHASREDEIRHARMTATIARRFGAEVPSVEIAPARPRDAFAIALENATEGCVRETYGALVAHYQARSAVDASLRRLMQVIAQDETRHAGLAWDVAAWLEPRLTVDERELVADARRRAIAALRAELAVDPTAELRTAAGLPGADDAVAMLDGLDRSFLAAA